MANKGVPTIHVAEFVGQRNLGVTWETYTHLMHDRTEVDYGRLLTEAGLPREAALERDGSGR
jgi:hypothetical protein